MVEFNSSCFSPNSVGRHAQLILIHLTLPQTCNCPMLEAVRGETSLELGTLHLSKGGVMDAGNFVFMISWHTWPDPTRIENISTHLSRTWLYYCSFD